MLDKLSKKDNLYIYILHHLGKMYHNIRQDNKAKVCFDEVLQLNPKAYETKLQIARISKNKHQREECIEIYREILDYYIGGGKISMSVVLAAYEDITFYLNAEIKEQYFIKHYDAFKEAIISLSGTSYDQPYIVLSNISKVFTYDYPDRLKELLDRLPLPSIEKIHKRNYFNIARMYMEFGKALLNLKGDSEEAEGYLKNAEYYFENIDNDICLKSFQVVQRTENFLLLNKYDDALKYLNEHVFEEDAFWWYRRSCTFLYLNKYQEAQKCCDKALEKIEHEKKKAKYLPTFYRKKAQIAFHLHEDEKNILNLMNMAIDNCDEGKYREQLKQEILIYQSEKKLDKN